MSIIETLEFKIVSDNRGDLVALEEFKNIPFDIKRVYYLYNTAKDQSRGFHAHKSLNQVIIAVAGECKLTLDNGKQRESIVLNKPNIGLVVRNMCWREMSDFSTDCVLLVLASEYYDESDYIREYQEFLRMAKNG